MKHAVSILPDGGKDRDWGEITHELEITEEWLADLIAAPPPGPDSKDELSAWVPGRFDGRRSVPTAVDRSLLGIDFDHVEDCDTVLDRFTRLGLRAFVHASFTVRNEDGTWRFRAYVPLDRPATAAEWPRVAAWTLSTFPEADPSCRDISRLFYLPVQREGYWSEVLGGAPLVVDSLPAVEASVSPATTAERAGAPSGDAAAVLASCWPATGRHAAQLALAGALCRDGWSEHRALDFLCDVCRRAGDEDRPKREKTIQRTYKLARDGGSTTGWTALEKSVPAAVVSAARAILRGGAEDERAFAELVGAPAVTPVTPSALGEQWGGWDALQAPPVYLLEGLIPEAKVVTFFAEGGSVKSWTALAIARAVAEDARWLGAYGVKPGKALYLDYEDGPYEFHRRVRFLTGGQDVPNLGYRYGGAQIDDRAFWVSLGEHVKALGVVLLVVDSVSASMPGDADENAPAFAQGVKLAGRFTEATGCTVLFVHHANKSGGMRGSSAIRDHSDVVFRFEPVSENDDGVKRMRLVCDKPGPQKRPRPVNVELSDKGLATFEDEAHEAGRNAFSGADIGAAIRLALADGPVASTAQLQEAIGRRRVEVLGVLKDMAAAGEVVRLDAGYALDSEALRTARVVRLLESDMSIATEGEVARHAFVDTRFVDRLRLLGVICQSQDGRWMVVKR